MSLTTGLQLPFGIQPVNPVPTDSWSGPYIGSNTQDAIDAANLAIPIEVRFQSMEVRLIVSGIAKKFWYESGVNDIDLVEFLASSTIGGREIVIYDTNSDYYVTSDNKNQYVVIGNPFAASIVFTDDLFELGDEIIIYLQDDYSVDVTVESGQTTYITYGNETIDESQSLTFEIFTELHFRCWTPNGFILTAISKPLATASGLQEVTDVSNTTDNSIEVTGSGDERVFISNSAYIAVNNADSTESISIEPNMISFGKSGFNHNLIVGTVTGPNSYILPDASGTIALLSDVNTSFVPYNGAVSDVNLGANTLNVQDGNETAYFSPYGIEIYEDGTSKSSYIGTDFIGVQTGDGSFRNRVSLDPNIGVGIGTNVNYNPSPYAWIKSDNINSQEYYQLPDKGGIGGTFAMLDDIGTTPSLQKVLTEGNTAENTSIFSYDNILNPSYLTRIEYDNILINDFIGATYNVGIGINSSALQFSKYVDGIGFRGINVSYEDLTDNDFKTVTFKNESGTIALVSDIAALGLQQVTDNDNTTTNSILVTSDGDTREVSVTSASGKALMVANEDTVFNGAVSGDISIGFTPRNSSIAFQSLATGRSQWIQSNITGVTDSSWANVM